MAKVTGLSGNEIYCLALKQYSAGELVVGNSVNSMGFLGSLGAGLTSVLGGEVGLHRWLKGSYVIPGLPQVTQAIHEGRAAALARLTEEASRQGASGVAGATGELRSFSGSTEFLFVGSCATPSRRPMDCSPALATHRNYFVTWTRAMSRSSMCSAMSLIPSAWAAANSAR
jgi:uncharacterized protein YbjQ (UPF0145 family)